MRICSLAMLKRKYSHNTLVLLPSYTVVISKTVLVRSHSPANIWISSSLLSNLFILPSNSPTLFLTFSLDFSTFLSAYTTQLSPFSSTIDTQTHTPTLTSSAALPIPSTPSPAPKLLRLRKLCSNDYDFETQSQLMAHRFILHDILLPLSALSTLLWPGHDLCSVLLIYLFTSVPLYPLPG